MAGFAPTVAHVREVIDTKLTDNQIQGILASSIALVSSRLSEFGVDGSLLIEIQRWVCAHDVSIVDPSCRAIEEELGEAKVKFPDASVTSGGKGTFGLLMTSWWGQRACSMDPTGTLANLGGPPPRILSLGFRVTSI